MDSSKKRIFLSTGSNEPGKRRSLEIARFLLQQEVGELREASRIYETAPWGKFDQPAFLNQVLEMETHLNPDELLASILAIETRMGRVRLEKWGRRLIDIDILFYADDQINLEHLQIPHPGIPDRRFVLIPLAEIAPDLVHPQSQKTIRQLLLETADDLEVMVYV